MAGLEQLELIPGSKNPRLSRKEQEAKRTAERKDVKRLEETNKPPLVIDSFFDFRIQDEDGARKIVGNFVIEIKSENIEKIVPFSIYLPPSKKEEKKFYSPKRLEIFLGGKNHLIYPKNIDSYSDDWNSAMSFVILRLTALMNRADLKEENISEKESVEVKGSEKIDIFLRGLAVL